MPDDGYCHGFSLKVLEAWLLKEQNAFNQRIKFIVNEKKLTSSIQALKEKVKQGEALAPEDHQLSEVLPFCESLAVAHAPELSQGHFNRPITQFDISNISYIAGSDKIQEQGGLVTVYSEIHAYSENNYIEQLNAFKKILSTDQGLILSANAHAISLTYDPDTQYWGLTDIGGWLLFETQDTQIIFQEILRGLEYPHLSKLFRGPLYFLQLPLFSELHPSLSQSLRHFFRNEAPLIHTRIITTKDKRDASPNLTNQLSELHDQWASVKTVLNEIKTSAYCQSSTYI